MWCYGQGIIVMCVYFVFMWSYGFYVNLNIVYVAVQTENKFPYRIV